MDITHLVPIEIFSTIASFLAWPDRVALLLTCRFFYDNIQNPFEQRLEWHFGRQAYQLPVPRSRSNLFSGSELWGRLQQDILPRRRQRKRSGLSHALITYQKALSNPQLWIRDTNTVADQSSYEAYAVIRDWKKEDDFLDVIIARDPTLGIDVSTYTLESQAAISHLTGHLHLAHSEQEIKICAASTTGFFISRTLLDHIPVECQPPIETNDQREVTTPFGHIQATGSAIVPFYTVTELVRFHFVLKFLVLTTAESSPVDMIVPEKYFNTSLSKYKMFDTELQWSHRGIDPAKILARLRGQRGISLRTVIGRLLQKSDKASIESGRF